MAVEGHVQQALGQNRQIVTQQDLFRASEYLTAVLSGANNYVSGFMLLSNVLSSVVRIRPLNIHLHNRESSHVTILFRDGSISGSIVAGPYVVNPVQGRTIIHDELIGRRFLSGIYPVVVSGPAFAQGIDIQIGYVKEPDPTSVGGLLE